MEIFWFALRVQNWTLNFAMQPSDPDIIRKKNGTNEHYNDCITEMGRKWDKNRGIGCRMFGLTILLKFPGLSSHPEYFWHIRDPDGNYPQLPIVRFLPDEQIRLVAYSDDVTGFVHPASEWHQKRQIFSFWKRLDKTIFFHCSYLLKTSNWLISCPVGAWFCGRWWKMAKIKFFHFLHLEMWFKWLFWVFLW